MPYTSLLLAESPRSLTEMGRSIEATGLFQTILTSTDPGSAPQQLREAEIDTVFLALDHLGQKATEMLRVLCRKTQDLDIPVLLLLGSSQEQQRILALECGVSDCFSNSTSAQELALRTRRCLDQKVRMDNLRRANQDLARQSITDALSGLHNRRYFDQVLETEVARSNRNNESFALLLLDLDHFKQINDRFGHLTGDKVISTVGRALQESIRTSDTCCRYGGEEFALIMPETRAPEAMLVAERLRRTIAGLEIPGLPKGHSITVSIGISLADPSSEIRAAQVVTEADLALYTAKAQGRNCCILRGEHRHPRLSVPRRSPSPYLFRLPRPCAGIS